MTARVFHGLDEVPVGLGPTVITVGKFDGVHLAHRAIFDGATTRARELGATSVAVTFDRNPRRVLEIHGEPPEQLVSTERKLELLSDAGFDAILLLRFDAALSSLSPEQFVDSVLIDALSVAEVHIGDDFRFGARGAGSLATLSGLGARRGFGVRVVDEILDDAGHRVSSTRIRELLDAGDVAAANRLLGRDHSVRAIVVHGEKRGRDLGYPTANLSREIDGYVPADGVYAAWATVGGTRYPAAASIGNNPTFDGVPARQVEAHLLDVTLDLYGQEIEVAFVDHVRPMLRFGGLAELIAAMQNDVAEVRELLKITAS